MALAAFALFARARNRAVALVLLALPGMVVQQLYVFESRGTAAAGGFPEIADPSRSRIMADFQAVLDANAEATKAGGVISDTQNIVLAKFESYQTRGLKAAFPGAKVGTSMMGFTEARTLAPRATMEQAIDLRDDVEAHLEPGIFHFHDGEGNPFSRFNYAALGPLAPGGEGGDVPPAETLLIATGPKQSVLNRWHWQNRGGVEAAETNFFARRFSRVRDHLLFVESERGRSYFLATADISMFQLEPDPLFYRGTTMAAVGRRGMFQVLRPTPGVRLMMELSSSLAADAENRLPTAAAVIGSRRHPLGLTGRGSARIFSAPLEPQEIAGRSFVGFDLGRDAVPFRQPRHGLMRLYGTRISLDRRWLVCFTRNISAVSAAQYASMKAPAHLDRFPEDFRNPRLEYSGFYEDGWVSDHAWAALAEPWDAGAVVVRGYVPELKDPAFTTEVTVRVDGREVARQTVGLKEFEVRAPLPRGSSGAAASQAPGDPGDGAGVGPGRRKVELLFSKLQNLPHRDRRPVAALMTFVGFESPPAPPVRVEKFPDDVHTNALLAPAGLYADGWVAPQTTMRLSQPPGHGYIELKGEVPNIGDGSFETTVRVRVDGRQVGEQSLRVGRFELAFEALGESAGAPGPRQVELEFTAAQQLPAGDGRTVSARLFAIGFAPEPLPPARLEQFPHDLRRPLVQPAGVYDDGWVGESASFRLAQPPEAEVFTVIGMVPKIGEAADFTTDVQVLFDGNEVARRTIGLDRFVIEVPLPPATMGEAAARRVELRFSRVQSLPPPDGRAVGAKLLSVGFDGDAAGR
jgi:hypothetical protein